MSHQVELLDSEEIHMVGMFRTRLEREIVQGRANGRGNGKHVDNGRRILESQMQGHIQVDVWVKRKKREYLELGLLVEYEEERFLWKFTQGNIESVQDDWGKKFMWRFAS
ncbi:hypothetical protein BYT27DRAFT_7209134 [Phlegmacium glaucopus]|nr:hypothetical protein BYT27DRAFT_7209134 [Phlegmacium glaucopus]